MSIMGSLVLAGQKNVNADLVASKALFSYPSVSENLPSEERSEQMSDRHISDEYNINYKICGTDDKNEIMKETPSVVLNQVIHTVDTIFGLRDENEFQECLQTLLRIYNDTGEDNASNYDEIVKYRTNAGLQLVQNKAIRKICRSIVDIWFEDYTNNVRNVVLRRQNLMLEALSTICCYCDYVPEVACDVAMETNFLETLKEILEFVPADNIAREQRLALALITNIAKVDENVSSIRNLKVMETLSLYLENKTDAIRLFALSALANIINEEENAILQNKHDLLKLLLEGLTSALETTSHKWRDQSNASLSAKELARTVRLLARNDANKILLVEMGSLLPLCKLVESGKVEEQREAVGAICLLTFDDKNQKKILEHDIPDIVRLIFNVKEKSDDEEVQKAADCTLFALREQLQKYERYKDIANFLNERRTSVAPETMEDMHHGSETKTKGHIMISYNRQHRKELQKIQAKLEQHKYTTWMDVNDMRGYLLADMAKAVESAHIVLICMSQGYKDSPYCRIEAKHAWKKGKHIVPLLMVQGYNPDGWLEILIEDAVYYDFSGKYNFELKFEDLLKKIKELYGKDSGYPGNGTENHRTLTVMPSHVSQSGPEEHIANLRQWKSSDVEHWIKKHNLPRKKFRKLTGRDLAGLLVMRKEAPEHFYRCLETKLAINSLSAIDMFTEALNTFKH